MEYRRGNVDVMAPVSSAMSCNQISCRGNVSLSRVEVCLSDGHWNRTDRSE